MMMVAMLSISFVSCSDDDDDVSNSIVGTWRYEEDDYYEVITFKSDGTGTWTEYELGDYDSVFFTYTYDYTSMVLVMRYEDGDTEKSKVQITGDVMYFDGDLFRRVK